MRIDVAIERNISYRKDLNSQMELDWFGKPATLRLLSPAMGFSDSLLTFSKLNLILPGETNTQ